MLRRRDRACCLLIALLVTAGCGDAGEPPLALADWTLWVDGELITTLRLPQRLGEAVPRHDREYTLQSEVRLPEPLQGRALSLRVPFLPTEVVLEVDGRHVIPHPRSVDMLGGWLPHRWDLPPDLTAAPTLHLKLTAQHAWGGARWLDSVPTLGEAGHEGWLGSLHYIINRYIPLAIALQCPVVAFLYIMPFAADRRLKGLLYFGFCAVAAAFYGLFILGVTRAWFGYSDCLFAAVVVAFCIVSAIQFTHDRLRMPAPSRLWWVALVLVAALALAAADPFVAPMAMAFPVMLIVVGILHQLRISIQQLVSKNPEVQRYARVLTFGWAGVGLVSLPDILIWLSLPDMVSGTRPASAGILLFIFLMALMLSLDYVRFLRQGEHLNQELAARVRMLEDGKRAIESLNAELRRQIADRAGQLFAALALIGKPEATAVALAPGTSIRKRYRVIQRIGEGGMGAVYEVERLADGRRLALKVAQGMASSDLARLAREAHVAAQVEHPNVVAILDVDIADEGYLFLVMEFVDGQTLQDLQHRAVDLSWTLEVLHQVSSALAALHAEGVVHRDLKPANLLVEHTEPSSEVRVKIADFGISRAGTRLSSPPPAVESSTAAAATCVASPTSGPHVAQQRLADEEALELAAFFGDGDRSVTDRIAVPYRDASTSRSDSLTQLGLVSGTPAYLAPELAIDPGALSPAVDVFAFGLIAYDLLAEKPAFASPPFMQRLEGKPIALPDSVRRHRPELDSALADQLDRCLSLDPSLRPSMRELADTLASLSELPAAPRTDAPHRSPRA